MLRRLRRWLAALRRRWASRSCPEQSRVIVGSTGSGKSEGELVDLVRLADRGGYAVVLLDGHGPLAFRAAGHWIARGHQDRLVYEPLDATDRVLCWDMLRRSEAPDPSRRLLEDAQTREDLAQCLMNPRGLSTLNDRGYTKEWLDAGLSLCLSQPQAEPLTALLSAFRVGSDEYERLLHQCTEPAIRAKFADLERIRSRNPVQYETLTGASRRLLELTCASEAVRLRSRPGPFRWLDALRNRSLIVMDGGGIRSRDLKRTLFLLVTLEVIQAVRRQFAETRRALPVVLVLEEAGAMGLVTPFVLWALQELRKAGLAIHVITQSALDFGDRDLFQGILANVPVQVWYQCLSPADQELGANALANATFDPLAVHFTRSRQVRSGHARLATESRGETYTPGWEITARNRREGTSVQPRFRDADEPHYKTPLLHIQEYRTRLATLAVGHRLVRDRTSVQGERVRPLRDLRPRGEFDARTRSAIDRVRQQPIYLPPTPVAGQTDPKAGPDAAARLLQLGGQHTEASPTVESAD